jgi:hypothetical protein
MAGIVGSKLARANAGLGNTTTVGPYTVHAFTTTGANTFTPATTGFVDILVVGGGGGGGGISPIAGQGNGGGGSGGSVIFRKFISVTAGTPYPITVGTGGASGTPSPTRGGNGTDTVFNAPNVGVASITAYGGVGGDGGPTSPPDPGLSNPLGSGSGGSGNSPAPGGTGAGVLGFGFPGFASNGGAGAGGGGGAGSGGPITTYQATGGLGVPISYMTGTATFAGVGGPGNPWPTPVAPTSYSSSTFGWGGNMYAPDNNLYGIQSGRPGVAYIRYI